MTAISNHSFPPWCVISSRLLSNKTVTESTRNVQSHSSRQTWWLHYTQNSQWLKWWDDINVLILLVSVVELKVAINSIAVLKESPCPQRLFASPCPCSWLQSHCPWTSNSLKIFEDSPAVLKQSIAVALCVMTMDMIVMLINRTAKKWQHFSTQTSHLRFKDKDTNFEDKEQGFLLFSSLLTNSAVFDTRHTGKSCIRET